MSRILHRPALFIHRFCSWFIKDRTTTRQVFEVIRKASPSRLQVGREQAEGGQMEMVQTLGCTCCAMWYGVACEVKPVQMWPLNNFSPNK